MSCKANDANSGGVGIAGLNLCATGIPQNYYLNQYHLICFFYYEMQVITSIISQL